MSYIGIVQIEDGKNRTGVGLLVNADGSINVNVQVMPAMASVEMSAASAGTTSGQILADDTWSGLMITNNDATDTVYIGFGGTGVTVGGGFPIPPGQTFAVPAGMRVTGPVHAISAAGSPDLRIVRFS